MIASRKGKNLWYDPDGQQREKEGYLGLHGRKFFKTWLAVGADLMEG